MTWLFKTFIELHYELIQVEQRKDVHLVLVNRLGSLPRNIVVRLTDRLDMTMVVDWDVKPQIKQNKNKIKGLSELISLRSFKRICRATQKGHTFGFLSLYV